MHISPANEFLLHACRQTDKPTYIDPPLDKRYNPIISTICGPNKFINIMVIILMAIIMVIMLSGYPDARQTILSLKMLENKSTGYIAQLLTTVSWSIFIIRGLKLRKFT